MVIIIFLVLINGFLLFIDNDGRSNTKNRKSITLKKQKLTIALIDTVGDEIFIGKRNIFERIDSILLVNKFSSKWIKNEISDSVYIKNIKVPYNISLTKYNLMFADFLAKLNISFDKVKENERKSEVSFFFKLDAKTKAKIVLKRNRRLSDFPEEAKFIIIIDDFGNQWGSKFIQGYINFPVPITLSVIPGHWASAKTAKGGHEAGKNIMIHMPMQPKKGSIEKEKIKILSKYNEKKIKKMLDLASLSVPFAVGLNNHEGSAGTTDEKLMKKFFNVFKNYDLFFVNSLTAYAPYCEEYALKNGVKYAKRDIFLDDKNEEEHIIKMFEEGMKRYNKGKTVVLIGHTRLLTYETLLKLVTEKYPDINYSFVSELFK